MARMQSTCQCTHLFKIFNFHSCLTIRGIGSLPKLQFTDAVQLLKNLRQSVATLQICGEWGSANDDATLEMSTQRVWMQGRAPQKRLTALQASVCFSRPDSTHHLILPASLRCCMQERLRLPVASASLIAYSLNWSVQCSPVACHTSLHLIPPGLRPCGACTISSSACQSAVAHADESGAAQNMWNRNNGTAQEAFALRFIFTAPDHREVHSTRFRITHQAGLSCFAGIAKMPRLPTTAIWRDKLKTQESCVLVLLRWILYHNACKAMRDEGCHCY